MEKITVAVIVLGIVLSTLHQSSLGSLFLMAPHRVHPLWYSPMIPVFFFISAIAAGLTMVVVESGLSHRLFRDRVDPSRHVDVDRLAIGLGRAAAVVLFAYFFLKLQGLADGGHWNLLTTPWGVWFLVEILGFVLLPSLLLAWGARHEHVGAVRQGAILAVLGVVLNRLNVSVIAFSWDVPGRYVPTWMEVLVSLVIVTAGVVAFRWVVNRMPVLGDSSVPVPER
jgi:Ni/Fe-hydrogenase subunit HybB-like protein